MKELTTSSLITELSDITSKKLDYNNQITALQEELAQSELVSRITKWQAMITELNAREIEIKNNGIKILQESWIDKFEANWVEVRIKTTAWSLIVTEQELIPKEFIKTTTKVTESVDKKALKEAIMKDWEVIDWCKIEQKVSLEVKYK